MDIMNSPIPDVRTSTIDNLQLPIYIKAEFSRDYWTFRVMFLPPSEKTKLCYILSTGFRTKIPLIIQLLEDYEVDINYKSPSKKSIPEELIIHKMNLELLGPYLRKRMDISTEIKNKCRALKPDLFPRETQYQDAQSNNRTNTFYRLSAGNLKSFNSYEQALYIMNSMKNFYERHKSEIDELAKTPNLFS